MKVSEETLANAIKDKIYWLSRDLRRAVKPDEPPELERAIELQIRDLRQLTDCLEQLTGDQ